jgi:hypothetical protein
MLKSFCDVVVDPEKVVAVTRCGDGTSTLAIAPRPDAEIVIQISEAAAGALIEYFRGAESRG